MNLVKSPECLRGRRFKITRVIIARDVKTRITVRIIFEGKRDMAATVAISHIYTHIHIHA
jgi:hypothetical protein